ncbi:hypothetical protein T265_00016 [Opisthorchis viverrini]|uniref:Uncharacterized protein n=1 Tax=Opisthorchis viverrini TaxID=6198 RepID=A0A075A366_OPIVI|nr:hypothetical protein T265_00016 [Opisthorchis viverrini]KER34138.1 hypothetical protein T265_00016 [Opisthorchis viverrini]
MAPILNHLSVILKQVFEVESILPGAEKSKNRASPFLAFPPRRKPQNDKNISIPGDEAIVTPIYKTGDRLSPSSYRPITFTSMPWYLILTYALFEQSLANRRFPVDPENTRRGRSKKVF